MTRTFCTGPLFLAGLALLLLTAPLPAQSPCEGCATCGLSVSCGSCGKGHCPPPYRHYFEGPPCIKFKRACPRPVCDPCNLEHYGYYPTCWAPWPFPADWSHCPCPPPGARLPPPAVPPFTPRTPAARSLDDPSRRGTTPSRELPTPRLDDKPPPRLDDKPSSSTMLVPVPVPPAEEPPVSRPLEERPAVRLVE
jgi:hypothetical protein